MSDSTVRRVSGTAGVLVGVLTTLAVPLYFIYSGPPPAWDVLTRDLVNLVTATLDIVFLAGLVAARAASKNLAGGR